MKACVLSMSVGVILKPPITTSVPALWVVVSLVITLLVPFLCGSSNSMGLGMPHTSTT